MATDAQSITAPPADKQIILHDGVRYTTVKEGLAYILVPEPSEEDKKKSKDGQGVQQVFYNPIQQFNRDLTVLAIKAYGKEQIAQKQVFKDNLCNRIKRKRKEPSEAERKTKAARLQNGSASKQTDDEAAPPVPAETETEPQEEAPAAAEAETASNEVKEPIQEEAASDSEPKADSTRQDSVEAQDGTDEIAKRPNVPNQPENIPPKFTILDAFSASALRALRYAHEIPFVTQVTSNDLLKTAVNTIKLNVKHNKLEDKITVSHDDALAHMYSIVVDELRTQAAQQGKKPKDTVPSNKYDVVDLDPYGTAAPFLDAAVQAVRDDGGLLCVTCTDSGVWASNGYPEKCYSLYGGIPLKGWYSHEVGLRLILHAIETSAAKYGLSMEPLLSLSIDYYTRVFVKIRKSPARVKFQGGKTMITYNCDHGCGAWSTQYIMKNKTAPNKKGDGIFYKHGLAAGPTVDMACEHCGSTMHIGGPMYGGRMHSPAFIKNVLAELPEADTGVYGTTERIRGMLQTALEEILYTPEEMKAMEEAAKAEPVDNKERKKREAAALEAELAAIDPYPFYFQSSHLAGTIHCAAPPERFLKGALRHMGYRVTRSHTKPGSIKTDAPWSVLWHVIREWSRQKAPVKEANIKPGSVAYRLLGLGEKKQESADGAAETNGTGSTEESAKTEETVKPQEQKKMPEVVFDESLGREVEPVKLMRYQTNPRENWGPMSRAKVWRTSDDKSPVNTLTTREIIFILKATCGGYLIFSLAESDSPEAEESNWFKLSVLHSLQKLPQEVLEPYLINSGSTDGSLAGRFPWSDNDSLIDVIVSTKSGTGKSKAFYDAVLSTLLSTVGFDEKPDQPNGTNGSNGSNDCGDKETQGSRQYQVTLTTSPRTVTEFANKIRDQSGQQRTMILLSGDGGVIDLLNGLDNANKPDKKTQPTVAILPLGTGNALFHSLHKPLYNSWPDASTAPSNLVLGLRTLFTGTAKPLPTFKASFSPRSRLISAPALEKLSSSTEVTNGKGEHQVFTEHLVGAIVASYGFHASLVWESDTPEYRVHGDKRFGMAAAELLKVSHAYETVVQVRKAGKPEEMVRIPRDKFNYVLTTMVSNLEKTFTISPDSKPLDGQLRLVHFGEVSGERTMEIMMAAYKGGEHVGMKWKGTEDKEDGVGYEEIEEVRVSILEQDPRWRKVCIDGTIVEIEKGGWMSVKRELEGQERIKVVVNEEVVV
ncbi:RNA methyltransferase [Rhypophila decipiens]